MLEFNFTPFPILETERLILRRVDNNDVGEIFSMRSNAETMKYIPRPLVTNNEEALSHIALLDSGLEKNEAINWAITFKGENKLLGIIGFYRTKFEDFRSEIGYMLLSENHGKGIGTLLFQSREEELSIKYPKHIITLGTSQHTFPFYEKMGMRVLEIIPNGYGENLHQYNMEK